MINDNKLIFTSSYFFQLHKNPDNAEALQQVHGELETKASDLKKTFCRKANFSWIWFGLFSVISFFFFHCPVKCYRTH